jgi:hypothetical protein
MSTEQVLSIAGKPDAIDKGEEYQSTNSTATPQHIGLLGFCAADRGENLAYIFFTEGWMNDIFRRDPLRDRYVILFFSAQGKFTRMSSNIADIPPIFPQSETRLCPWLDRSHRHCLQASHSARLVRLSC